MNKNNKLLLGGLGLLGSLTLLVGVSSAFAYWGGGMMGGRNYNPERRAQMEKAFETNDYNTWKELMNGKGRMMDVINEGNFSRFAQMHQLMKEGKTEEALAIRKELGLGEGRGVGWGTRNWDDQGRRGGNCHSGWLN